MCEAHSEDPGYAGEVDGKAFAMGGVDMELSGRVVGEKAHYFLWKASKES